MTAYIVTGTTRGVGRALIAAIIEKGHDLYSFSSAASHTRKQWQNRKCDLRSIEEVADAIQQVMDSVAASAPDEVVLINNAGALSPMGPLADSTADQIVAHLLVNQAAPAILMSAFIRRSAAIAGKRRIINISSGAARHPYHGWAMYCASKAAMDMVTRCAAAEQKGRPDPVTISALYPGKVDTDMQRQVRHADPAQFPARELFVQAKALGELLAPDVVARLIVALDEQGQLKNGGVYDLRNAVIDVQGRVSGLAQIVEPLPATAGPTS